MACLSQKLRSNLCPGTDFVYRMLRIFAPALALTTLVHYNWDTEITTTSYDYSNNSH